MAWKVRNATETKHTCGGPSFGRLMVGCPRCDELASGSKPREWGGSDRKAYAAYCDRERTAAIRDHNCVTSHCGTVCTAFDW